MAIHWYRTMLGESMASLAERILPELTLIEPGRARQQMLKRALGGHSTQVAAFLSVIVAVGLFILWDKLIMSVPSHWALQAMSIVFAPVFGVAMWFMRQDIRRRLRAELAKEGVPVCVPCGYNLTGNESTTCPECGASVADSHPD